MRVWQLVKVILALGLVIALSLAGCARPAPVPTPTPTPTTPTPTPTPAPTPTQAGPYERLKVALFTLGNEKFDPIAESATTALQNLSPIFDILLSGEGAKITPGVAERWELAPDGLSWVFYIRKGIKFHNGEQLTADDVAFTINRYASQTAIQSDTRTMVERVEKVDDYTVRVYTKGPQPFYPHIIAPFARGQGLIQPKDYFEQYGIEYVSRHPVGSGPFKFVRYVPGDMIEYEALDKHWRQVCGFKKLTLIKIPEESTRIAMLKTGEVDAIEVSPESSVEVELAGFRTSAMTAEQATILLAGNYQPEAASMPTSDIRVRQALSLAINKSEIIESLFYGKALPVGPFPVHAVSADIDIPYWMDYAAKAYRYDPEEAKSLLKETRWPDGFTIRLWAVNYPGAPYMPRLAEVVQAYWARIGVKAEIVTVDYSVYLAYRDTFKTPQWIGAAFTFATSPNPAVPERMVTAFRSTGHTHLFGKAMPEVDSMIDSALTEMDPIKRKEIEDRLIKIITDSYVSLMIARVPSWIATGPRVDFDFPPPPSASPFGYYLDTAKHKK